MMTRRAYGAECPGRFTGEQRAVPREVFAWLGLDPTTVVDHLGDAPPQASEAGLTLPPYAALWLTAPRDTAG